MGQQPPDLADAAASDRQCGGIGGSAQTGGRGPSLWEQAPQKCVEASVVGWAEGQRVARSGVPVALSAGWREGAMELELGAAAAA